MSRSEDFQFLFPGRMLVVTQSLRLGELQIPISKLGVCAKLASAHAATKTIDKELSHLKRLWC